MTRTWVGAQIGRDHEQVSLKVQHKLGKLRIVLERLSGDAQGGDGLVHVAASLDQQIILGDAATEEPAGRPIVTGLGVDRARRFAHWCTWAATGALHGHGSWKNSSVCRCPGRAPSPRAARAQSATKPGAPATNTSRPHRSPNSAGSSPGNRPRGGSPACPVRVRTKRRPEYCRCQEAKRSIFITSACVRAENSTVNR